MATKRQTKQTLAAEPESTVQPASKPAAVPAWAPQEPPTAAPALAALARGVPIRLKQTRKGSMQIRKTAHGLEFEVSKAQLGFIVICLDIARVYNDEHLEYETKDLRRDNSYPGDSRWHRDPQVAKANNRYWDMMYAQNCERTKAAVAEVELHAKQAGLGVVA
jgi:hypothetical protein